MKSRKIVSIFLMLAMLMSLVPMNIVFAEGNVASITTDGTTTEYATFDVALAAAKAGDKIDIIKNTTYVGSIDKKIDINIKDGITFTYSYNEGIDTNKTYQGSNIFESLFCNANITVENGGTVEFNQTATKDSFSPRYLIMNGNFELQSGGVAKLGKAVGNGGGVLFQSDFINNGTFKGSSTAKFYIKYGKTPGTITNGFAVYNLCLTKPSDETLQNRKIKITKINGKVAVGETLTAEIEGFGDSANLPDALNSWVQWKGATGYKGKDYKILSGDVGKKVQAKLGTLSSPSETHPYDYLAVNGDVVVTIHNGSGTYTETDAEVPAIDKIYVGGESASDTNSGTSADKAVKNFATAVDLVKDGGTVVVCGNVTVPQAYTDYDYNFISKNITFTGKDGDTEYDATLTGGTEEVESIVVMKGNDLTFTASDIKLDGVFQLVSYYDPNAVFTFDNVTCNENAAVLVYAAEYYGFYPPFKLKIDDCNGFYVMVGNSGCENAFEINLDNSDVTVQKYEDSFADVTLKNKSVLRTDMILHDVSSDNTDNAIKPRVDDEGYIVPIVIEGDVTIAENKPITVMFDGTLPFNTKIFSSTTENTSLTADKFKSSQTGTTLKKENNDIFTAAEVYSITYVLDDGTLGENSPTTHTYGTETTLVTPTKSGYNFDGWYLEDTFDNKVETLTAEGYTDNITLYAKWNKRSSGGGTTRYTVKFNANGGNIVTSQTVKKNGTATEPKKPTKDGYIFDGWYTDRKFANEYDFDTKVTKNITLYAKWVEDEVQSPSDDKKDDEQKPTTDDWKNPFTDVKKSDWFFDDVKYANENGLMTGITNNTFAPNDNITRGMFVTVLYRLEGEPVVNKSIPFADVNVSQYYANAVIWAEQNNIVEGYSETEYAPDENITREQIATILYRYAKFKGYDVTQGGMQIREYEDFESISNYAINAMTWAVNTGLMKGKTNTTLNPKDNATRAEIAAILNRFIESNK